MTASSISQQPMVSVVIPMVDEEQSIGRCLDAVFGQDYNPASMEVIVVDGGSKDASVSIVRERFQAGHLARMELLHNPGGRTPTSLNRALEVARGEIVARVDARSFIPTSYVSQVAAVLRERPEVVVVGGAQVARAKKDSGPVAQGIARALRNPYLTGLSRYRRRRSSGPTDTVYLGVFRRADLLEAGGWNEAFATNQDYELNRRMASSGKVWFDGSLEIEYQPRERLRDLLDQYRRFGRWKAAAWWEGGDISARHGALIGTAVVLLALLPGILRRPFRRGKFVVLAAFGIEATVREPGSLRLRSLSLVASGTTLLGWFAGVLEQSARFALGGRLLRLGGEDEGNAIPLGLT